jgi:anti-sigma-K factor RskA
MLWSGRSRDRQEIAAIESRLNDVAAREQTLTASVNRYRKEAEMAARTDIQAVAMRSTQPDNPMAATFYWNKSKGEAYVSVQKLPPPPEGMQYQLWAIAGGKPVSIGMLENETAVNGGMQKVPAAVSDGQAFAVSLEKAGGSPAPTAERIYLLGKMPA